MSRLVELDLVPWLTAFAQNVAMGLVLILVYNAVHNAMHGGHRNRTSLLIGATFGVGAIVSMALLTQPVDGLRVDARNIFVLVGSMFGGPLGALLAGGSAGLFRLWLGGPGALPGFATVALTAAMGALIARRFTTRDLKIRQLYAIGLINVALTILLARAAFAMAGRSGLPLAAEATQLIELPIGVVLLGNAMALVHQRLSLFAQWRVADIVESVSDLVWEMDAKGRFTFLSTRSGEVLGIDPKEAIGKTPAEIGSRWADAETESAVRAAHGARQPYSNITVQVPARDGVLKTFSLSARPAFDGSGRFVGYRGSAQDISGSLELAEELRRSREHLARVQSVARIGSTEVDLSTQQVVWSDEIYRLLGVDRATIEPSVEAFAAAVHPNDRALLTEVSLKGRRGIEVEPIEFRVLQPDGALRWLYRKADFVRDAAGRPVSLIATMYDISERKAAEDTVRRGRDAMARAQRIGRLGSAEIDLVTGQVTWSDEMYALLGIDPAGGADVERYLPLVHAEDRPRLRAWIDLNLRGEAAGVLEYRYLHPDGRQRWFRRDVEVERDAHGRAIKLCTTQQDITEQKQLEEALRRSHDSLVSAQRLGKIGSLVLDVAYGAVECSEELFRICGLDSPDAMRTREQLFALVHPDDRDAVRAESERNALGIIGKPLEFRVIRPDGQVRWLHREAEAIRDEKGRVAKCLVVAQDITDQRAIEQELRRSRDHLVRAQSVGQIGSAEVDLIARADVWSNEYCRLLGLDPGTTTPSRAQFIEAILPEDRGNFFTYDELVRHKGPLPPVEFRVRHGDGGIHWLRRHAETRFDHHGQPTSIVFTLQDITATKHAEDQMRAAQNALRAIMDNTVDGLITIDESGTILSFNHTAETIFGHAADEAIGANVSILMPSPHAERHDGYVSSYLSTGKAKVIGVGREVQGKRKDGTVFAMDLNIAEIVGDSGGRRFVGTVRDITQRKSIEAQLRQSQKMEAMGQLTGGVAHDFNNLLSVILGRLQLLEEELADRPRLQGWARSCIKAVDRGATLTRCMLAFSRQQSLLPVELDLNEVVADVEDMLRRTLGEAYDVRVTKTQGLWPVEADPGQLQNALLNLVFNARDAMPKGGAVTVSTTNTRLDAAFAASRSGLRPGDYVELTVSDTGVGMPPEVLERVFEPFFTTKDVGKGSGLGLSMVYGFAKQSGGHVAIYSEPGHGTVVRIYLPRKLGTDSMSLASRAGLDGGVPPRGTETILVVEDNDDLRDLTRIQLERLGYTVFDATHGAQALELLAGNPAIELLLSDVILPHGMTGPELAERALAVRPDLKIVFASGYNEEHEAMARTNIGRPLRLLQKPFHAEALAAQIRAALDEASSPVSDFALQ